MEKARGRVESNLMFRKIGLLKTFKVTAKLFRFLIPVESVITLIVHFFLNKIDQITVILIISEPETFAGTLKSTRFSDPSDQPAQLLLCSSLPLLFLRIINAYQRPLLSSPLSDLWAFSLSFPLLLPPVRDDFFGKALLVCAHFFIILTSRLCIHVFLFVVLCAFFFFIISNCHFIIFCILLLTKKNFFPESECRIILS